MKNVKRVCRIKEIMCEHNISSEEMRLQLELSRSQMEKLEYGHDIEVSVLQKVCNTYKVDISELL